MRVLSLLTEFLWQIWPHLTVALSTLFSLCAAAHAVLYKRDPRSAVGWVGVILLFPIAGPLLYFLLGINRIQRRAAHLRRKIFSPAALQRAALPSPHALKAFLPSTARHLLALDQIVTTITGTPLLAGNACVPLVNGDQAYPAMLDAISHAQFSISLSTYILGNDDVGRAFVDALAAAVRRGVAVRVLVDAVGARYSHPTIRGPLRRAGIPHAFFIPTLTPWRAPYFNLRNHRKLLIIDGSLGFTGGMNIRANNLVSRGRPDAVQDLHFLIRGPVVAHLQETFAEDWLFSTGEDLSGPLWFPQLSPAGSVIARGIPDGPDEDFGHIARTLHGAVTCAQHSIRILTPYFLPDNALISALNTAALRGVSVDIILPRVNNLRWVGWAMMAHLWQVLEWGCRVWLSPPPFDHSKLLLVDDQWCLFGSANWDPRSLRLNFEFNVEAYCPQLAATLRQLFEAKHTTAQQIRLEDVDARPLPIRLRDGIARLFTPYL